MIKHGLRSVMLAVLLALGASAFSAEGWEEGVHYFRLAEPQAVDDPSKIEVKEYFWYGCGHCYHFEPLVKAWKTTLPEDVAFVQTPAVWNRMMQLHAHLFYAAEALGVLSVLHDPFFHALQEERNPLTDPTEIVKRFKDAGAPEAEIMAAIESPEVTAKVRAAAMAMQAAELQGVPGLVVAGKFRIGAAEAGSQEAMLEIADFLVVQERLARGNAAR